MYQGDNGASAEGSRHDVNQLLIQSFLNYNLPDGGYLSTSPIMTANREADIDKTWTVPIGGGFGKILKYGKQPMSASLQGYYGEPN